MILAISGPSSTGKTTLLRDLYKRSHVLGLATNAKEIILVEETARTLFEDYFSDRYDTFEELLGNDKDTMEFQLLVAKDQLASYEEYKANDHNLYLCDRCPLDTMVYLSLNYQYASAEVREQYRTKYLDTLKKLWDCYHDANIRTYRTFPFPDESIEADGFRPIQYTYRRQAELLAFDLMNVNMLSLPANRHSRIETVLNNLLDDSLEAEYEECPNLKYKMTGWDNLPYKEGQDEIPLKVLLC